MSFLNKFPKIHYDITQNRYKNYDIITNIMFRFAIINNVLQNISAYYLYRIKNEDRPEILAEKIYNNPEAYWIILYANNMVDPHYDWPLDERSFQKYILSKYGSLANAMSTYHHHEKVIARTESFSGIIIEKRIQINEANLTSNLSSSLASVPYDYYENLPETQEVNTYNFGNNRSVTEIIKRDRITNYDWELNENEKKREIKIIKKEYYNQIMDEFDSLFRNKKGRTIL
jgi:hypothetical protein